MTLDPVCRCSWAVLVFLSPLHKFIKSFSGPVAWTTHKVVRQVDKALPYAQKEIFQSKVGPLLTTFLTKNPGAL